MVQLNEEYECKSIQILSTASLMMQAHGLLLKIERSGNFQELPVLHKEMTIFNFHQTNKEQQESEAYGTVGLR